MTGATIRSIALTLAIAAASPAAAQEPEPKGVAKVIVVSSTGTLEGRMVDLSEAGLRLFIDRQVRQIPLDKIERIDTRGDSVKNGALIGGAIGLAVGLAFIGEYGGEAAGFTVGNVLTWSVLGAGVDALIPRKTTIYRKPQQ